LFTAVVSCSAATTSAADTEDGCNYYRLVLSTTLLPGQDNLAPSSPVSGASDFVVSCGFRLSEVGFSEFRKPQVAGSIPVAGSRLQGHLEPN